MTNNPKQPKRSWLSFRLWHSFVIIAIAAWYSQHLTLLGNCEAVIVIEKMTISYDDQWDRHWATLDGKFLAPNFLEDQRVECFIDVDESFSFGERYAVGDELRFRYQYKKFANWEKQDPRQRVVKKFFDLNVVPSNNDPGLLILVRTVEERENQNKL